MNNLFLSFLMAFVTLFTIDVFSFDHQQKSQATAEPGTKISDFSASLSEASKVYFDLKESIFAGDTKNAAEKASSLYKSVLSVEPGFQQEKQIADWQSQLKDLQKASEALATAKEIADQRTAFINISHVLNVLVKKYGPLNFTVYLYHCPMAGDSGGHWLSQAEEVANPFFGDKMAKCGALVETYAAKQ